MGFLPFHEIEPELAERETRTVTLIRGQGDLPEGAYALIESYCPDPTCDCRRVMRQQSDRKRKRWIRRYTRTSSNSMHWRV